MTFRPELWGGCEAAKIAPLVVPYLQGRCLDIGSGIGKVWPKLIGIDTATDRGRPVTDLCMDGTDLSLFGDETFDGVFSSFLLQEFPLGSVPKILTEWARVMKIGAHLVLYLPMDVPEDFEGAPKWNATVGELHRILMDNRAGWTIIECEERSDGDEYGLLFVARKEASGVWRNDLRQRNPGGKRRALVIRYGAIGDAIVAASVLPGLKAQGFHITFNCKSSTQEVLLHDPHIDEWMIQETDFVPNEMLGSYWKALEERYDRIVNLCESVEGLMLTLPGRLNHGYSDEARRAIYGRQNYLEHTHNIAGVPHEFAAKFYPAPHEMEKARWDRRRMSGPVVVWVINGSSSHKVWPWVHIVTAWLLARTPAHIVFYADPGVGKELQTGIMSCLERDGADMSRVHGVAGQWDIRRSLTFAHVVDCVVGPETGPMNAVGMADVKKVIYLSHSSADNLTKHWMETTVLEPDNTKAKCAPCHRLHSTWEFCFKDEQTGAALCASSISPERVFEAIALAIGAKRLTA